MESYNDVVGNGWDIVMGISVLTLYIVGKVWMYHKFYNNEGDTKENKGSDKG